MFFRFCAGFRGLGFRDFVLGCSVGDFMHAQKSELLGPVVAQIDPTPETPSILHPEPPVFLRNGAWQVHRETPQMGQCMGLSSRGVRFMV